VNPALAIAEDIKKRESDAKFLDEREEIAEYVRSLETGKPLDENQVRAGYEQFKAEKQRQELADLGFLKRTADGGVLKHQCLIKPLRIIV